MAGVLPPSKPPSWLPTARVTSRLLDLATQAPPEPAPASLHLHLCQEIQPGKCPHWPRETASGLPQGPHTCCPLNWNCCSPSPLGDGLFILMGHLIRKACPGALDQVWAPCTWYGRYSQRPCISSLLSPQGPWQGPGTQQMFHDICSVHEWRMGAQKSLIQGRGQTEKNTALAAPPPASNQGPGLPHALAPVGRWAWASSGQQHRALPMPSGVPVPPSTFPGPHTLL